MTDTGSYTQTHAVAHSFECKKHAVTMSGDDIPDDLVALWDAMHNECDKEGESE